MKYYKLFIKKISLGALLKNVLENVLKKLLFFPEMFLNFTSPTLYLYE